MKIMEKIRLYRKLYLARKINKLSEKLLINPNDTKLINNFKKYLLSNDNFSRSYAIAIIGEICRTDNRLHFLLKECENSLFHEDFLIKNCAKIALEK